AAATIVYDASGGTAGPYSTMNPDTTGSGGTCKTSNTMNWGQPYRDGTYTGCYSYFPIIRVAGSVTNNVVTNGTGNFKVTGGYGQGILLVDGDMDVQGGFQFYGPVIILGHLTTSGGGSTSSHFFGGVMASDVNLEQNTVLGNAVINYSSCSILTALKG